MFFRGLILLQCLLSATAAADATAIPQQAAAVWLDKMIQAMKSLNYQGTVVFMKNNQVDTMKYRHRAAQGGEQEFLVSLNSPLREVTRKTNEVSCIYKDTSQKIIDHHPVDSSFIVNLPVNADSLQNIYALSVGGRESVAMHDTQILDVLPLDQLRFRRRIWIDTVTYLPLKVEVYNFDGGAIDQVMFTEFNAEPNQSGGAQEPLDTQGLNVKHIHAAQAEPFEKAPFTLQNWPRGFKTVFFIRNSLQPSKPVDHLLLSDGFTTLSVYLEVKNDDGIEGLHGLGAVNSFSRVIDDYQVTVLGEAPAETVEAIAAGVALK